MVKGQEHAKEGWTGQSSVDYNSIQDKYINGTKYSYVWVLMIALSIWVLNIDISVFEKSGQSFSKTTTEWTRSTRIVVEKPKIYNDTIRTNTGSHKRSNSQGDGGFILTKHLRSYKDKQDLNWLFKGKQWNYSTKCNAEANNPGVTEKNKSNIIKLENNKFTGLYKQITELEMLILSYQNIKSKPGNMTLGTDNITLDGISMKYLENLSDSLKNESFQFKPARRVMIPKKNGKARPIAIASPRDKIIQEGMRIILESIFEPIFLDYSHGFRPNRGCHTALKEISTWNGTTWVLEGDIKGFFDSVDHHILEGLLCLHIQDQRFIDLYWKLVRAGYVEKGVYIEGQEGVPQGSIVSPILSNIYLHELDKFLFNIIDKESYKGKLISKVNPKIVNYSEKISKLALKYRETKNSETLKELKKLRKERNQLPSRIRTEIRLRYVRYADDWVIGISGTKEKAREIKKRVTNYLLKELKITLNEEKTKITHLGTEKAKFLGILFFVLNPKEPKLVQKYNWKSNTIIKSRITMVKIVFLAPYHEIIDKLRMKGFIKSKVGQKLNASAITKWIFLDHKTILLRYNSVIRGLLNYYTFVDNFYIFHTIVAFILRHSCAKTLARKFNLGSRAGAFKKFGKNLTVKYKDIKLKSKQLSLYVPKTFKKTRKFLINTEIHKDPFMVMNFNLSTISNLGENCAICGEIKDIEMHHIKHLRKDNIKSSGFLKIMSSLNRKQLPLCVFCHNKVHAGKYNGISLNDLWINKDNDKEKR